VGDQDRDISADVVSLFRFTAPAPGGHYGHSAYVSVSYIKAAAAIAVPEKHSGPSQCFGLRTGIADCAGGHRVCSGAAEPAGGPDFRLKLEL